MILASLKCCPVAHASNNLLLLPDPGLPPDTRDNSSSLSSMLVSLSEPSAGFSFFPKSIFCCPWWVLLFGVFTSLQQH